MKRIFALLAVLLPIAAGAQSWTEGTPIASVVTDYDQTFTWSYSAAGESNNLDVSACNKPVVTISGANNVTGYSCQSASAPKSACTPVVAASGQSFGPEPVTFPGGFAKFWVSSFSAASSVDIACLGVRNKTSVSGSWQSREGRTADIPGYVDGICYDPCKDYLRAHPRVAPAVFHPPVAYFDDSNLTGEIRTAAPDDTTGDGSWEKPLQSLAECAKITNAGGTCLFDGPSTAAERGVAGVWDDNATEWKAAASAVKGAIYTNTAFDLDAAPCEAGDLCSMIVGIGSAGPTTISCNGTDSTYDPDGAGTENVAGDVSTAVVRIHDTKGVTFVAANIDITDCPPTNNNNQDIFRYEAEAGPPAGYYTTTVLLNVTSDTQGANNPLFTSHMQRSRQVIFGGGCTIIDSVGSTADNDCISHGSTEFVDVVFGGRYVTQLSDSANGSWLIGSSPYGANGETSQSILIDNEFYDEGADDSQQARGVEFAFITSAGQHATYDVYLDGNWFEGFDRTHTNAGAIKTNTGSNVNQAFVLKLQLYRNSGNNLRSFWWNTAQADGLPVQQIRTVGNLATNITTRAFHDTGLAGSCDQNDWYSAYNVWDQDVSTEEFRVESTNYSTAALARAGADSAGCGPSGTGYSTFFEDDTLDSDAATEFAGLDKYGACDVDGDCNALVPLSEIQTKKIQGGCIHPGVFGVPFCGFGARAPVDDDRVFVDAGARRGLGPRH